MEQTAIKQALDYLLKETVGKDITRFCVAKKLTELLQVEKHQIVEANNKGYDDACTDNGITGEQYYNDKFGEL